jgi:hypothetical protein
MAKFALTHSPSPDSLFYEGPHYAKRCYQSLMYAGLRPFETLHKKTLCIGPALCKILGE